MSELAHDRKDFSSKLTLPESENKLTPEKSAETAGDLGDLAKLAGLIIVLSKTYQILEPWLIDFIKNSTVEQRLKLRTTLEAGGTGIFPVSSQAYRVSAQLTALTSEKSLNEFIVKNGRNR
jgi:hypothetical protein